MNKFKARLDVIDRCDKWLREENGYSVDTDTMERTWSVEKYNT